jgi:phosphonate transport system substrate-binding protein
MPHGPTAISTPLSRRVVVAALPLLAVGCKKDAPGRDRPLVVVLGPQYAPRATARLEARLRERTGLLVVVRVASSSDEAVDWVQAGTADAALLTLFDFLYCQGLFEVTPLAQVVRGDHVTTASELLVAEASPAQSLADLAGTKVGYVDRFSVTGFLLPAAQLGAAKVQVTPVFLGSHDAVLEAVRSGAVAAGASYEGHGVTVPGLRVLAKSAPIANEPVFARTSLPAEVREKLQQAFLAEADAQVLEGLADVTGFRAPPEGTYESALAALKAAGLSVEDTLPGGWLRANEHRRPAWSYGP